METKDGKDTVDTNQVKQESAEKDAPKDAQKAVQKEAPDPRKMLVKIKLQKPFNSKSKGQTINVNNHRFFIPYGKTVEVPFFIAEIARLSSEQDENTALMIEKLDKSQSD